MIQFIKENINGILGTVAFHLVLIIIFLSIKISSTKSHSDLSILIEFEELEDRENLLAEENRAEQPLTMDDVDRVIRRNIAVNVAEEFRKNISTENYVEQLKQDLNITTPLIRDLNRPNQISEPTVTLNDNQDLQIQSSRPQHFAGPTTIYYELEGRWHRRLPIPVYRCEGSGKIVVEIQVNQRGEVTNASVINAESSQDDCLFEMATQAAYNSLFNADFNAASRQKGKITYHFVAQ